MSIQKMFASEHYRSILFLTSLSGEKGIRLVHYRYFLVKNKGGLVKKSCIDEVKNFYEDNEDFFNLFVYLDLINVNCITSRTNLSNFIKRLDEEGLIEIFSPNGFNRYRLTKIGGDRVMKWLNMRLVEVTPYEWQEKLFDLLIKVEYLSSLIKELEYIKF